MALAVVSALIGVGPSPADPSHPSAAPELPATRPETVTVPGFIGASREDAKRLAKSLDLKIKFTDAGNPPTPALSQTVATQSPERGKQATAGTTLTLGVYGTYRTSTVDRATPSMLDCSGTPHSSPRWNIEQQKTTCMCNVGYIMQNGSCVDELSIELSPKSDRETATGVVTGSIADGPPAETSSGTPKPGAEPAPSPDLSARTSSKPPDESGADSPSKTAELERPMVPVKPPSPAPEAEKKEIPLPAQASLETAAPPPPATPPSASPSPRANTSGTQNAICSGHGELIEITASSLASYGWNRYILPGADGDHAWACVCRPNYIANGVVSDKTEAKCLPAKIGRACRGGGRLKEVGTNFSCDCPEGSAQLPAGGWSIPMLPSCLKYEAGH